MTDQSPSDLMFGFDGAADDTCVVALRRGPGNVWTVENADGVDRVALEELVARICAGNPPPLPRLPAVDWPSELARLAAS